MTNTKALIGLLIATVGSVIFTALTFASPHSTLFIVLTIITAVLAPIGTYVGVYGATNTPKVPTPTGTEPPK